MGPTKNRPFYMGPHFGFLAWKVTSLKRKNRSKKHLPGSAAPKGRWIIDHRLQPLDVAGTIWLLVSGMLIDCTIPKFNSKFIPGNGMGWDGSGSLLSDFGNVNFEALGPSVVVVVIIIIIIIIVIIVIIIMVRDLELDGRFCAKCVVISCWKR